MEIEGYEDYTIDENGNVWSKYSDRFLNPSLRKKGGYSQVSVSKNGKRNTFGIHQLLALTFIPNPDNKPTVDHIDQNPSNNNLSNLRWATRVEQNENRRAFGEIKHKYICYKYNKRKVHKYYCIEKKGYFSKRLNVNDYTLKDAVDLRRSFLMYYKLPPISQDE